MAVVIGKGASLSRESEATAANPHPVEPAWLNHQARLPYGCTPNHILKAMEEFVDFLGLVNARLYARGLERLESFLMPANFSSIVGEFMTTTIPKYCSGLAKNSYHNGHPDLIPKGRFPNDSVQYAHEGIEVKASRYLKAWQGHNPEDIWLMVFVFDANGPRDKLMDIPPKPFRFVMVLGAELTKKDWKFAGRSADSRRTITASVTKSGYEKMMANCIYRSPFAPES